MKYIHVICVLVLFHHVMYAAEVQPMAITWKTESLKINQLPQNALAIHALNVAKVKFQGKEKILQFGLHDGGIAELLARHIPNGKLICVGHTDEIKLAEQNENIKVAQEKNLVLQNAISSIQEDNHDYIMSFLSVSWIREQATLFSTLYSILKTEGKLLVLLTHENDPLFQACCQASEADRWKGYFHDYQMPFYPSNDDSLVTMLQKVGFKRESITINSDDAKIDPIKQSTFKLGIMPLVGALNHRIPKDLHSDFSDDVIKNYINIRPTDEEGNILLGSGLLLAIAKK